MLQYFETLTDDSGNSLLGATVTVTAFPGGGAAAIYSTNGTASPIAASTVMSDITGQVSFFIPDGAYILTYIYKGTTYKVKTPVQMIDPLAFTAMADAGSANTYVINDTRLPVSLYTGLKVEWKAAVTNTGASTLNLNSTGAVALVVPGGASLTGGSIIANGIFRAEYDGAQWQLQAPIPPGPPYPVTAVETALSVSVVNTSVPSGYVDRYAVNTTPGTTDMGPALQIAINVALATVGNGQNGVPIRFQQGAYSIATLPSFGAATTLIIPIDIGGVGDAATQLIHNGTISTAPLFKMTGKNGWCIHDLMITGNSAHKNDGIYAGGVGGPEQILWRVENVTSYMAGVGLQVADTNDFVVRRFKHWPNNGMNSPSPGTDTLPIAQSVSASDIGHGIHVTGGFVNLGTFYDCVTQPSTNFFGGSNAMRGILIDCSSSTSLTFIGCDVESYGGAAGSEVGFAVTSSGSVSQLTVINLYQEGTQVQLTSVVFSTFIGLTDATVATSGNSVGTLVLNAGTRQNLFVGVSLNVLNESSASNYGNTFQNCNIRTTWTDNSTGPVDRRLNCLVPGGGIVRDWGGTDSVNINQTSAGTAAAPNCFTSNFYRLVEIAGAIAFTINAPSNPVLGFEMTIVIANATGGAGPQPTFAAGYHMTSNTPANPANGNESTFRFKYNGSTFQQIAAPAATVPD
jgi:hypothetical protein